MIRTLTLVFSSVIVGIAIGVGLMYLPVSRSNDTAIPMPAPATDCTSWGNVRP